MRLTRILIALAYALLTLVATPADAQTCSPPNRCLSPERANALVDAACARARAAETRLPDVVSDLDRCQTQRDELRGELRVEPPEPWRLPVGIRIAWDLAVASTAGAAGVLMVSDVPDGVRWSAVTLAGVLTVGRVIAELVD